MKQKKKKKRKDTTNVRIQNQVINMNNSPFLHL